MTDPGESWNLRDGQIVGNAMVDEKGQQRGVSMLAEPADRAEQCLDVRGGDFVKGIVQLWYCDEANQNRNQQWIVEPL